MSDFEYRLMLIKGYKEHKNSLISFFFRQLKIANDTYIEPKEFYNSCKIAIAFFYDQLEKLKFNEVLNLTNLLHSAKNKKINIKDFPVQDGMFIDKNPSSGFYDFYCQKLEEIFSKELLDIDKRKFYLPLDSYGYKTSSSFYPINKLGLAEIEKIEKAINLAFKKYNNTKRYKPVFKYCKPTYNIFEGKHQANKINNLYYITYPGKLSDLNEEILQFLSFIFYGIENTGKTGFDAFTYFDKQELNEILIEQIILNISRIRPTIGDDRYFKYEDKIIKLLNDYKKNIILNADNTVLKNTNPSDKYFSDFFNQIDNKDNLSISDFFSTINDTIYKFKTEIITNLENKESDRSKLFYLERIKLKFKELVPETNTIGIYPWKYKKSCIYWCKQYNCEFSNQLFRTFSSSLNPMLDALPDDLHKLTDFPKARKIYDDFYFYIHFNSIKEVYEFLIEQERIINPPPIPAEKPTDGSGFITEKNLVFINSQFKDQIQKNGLTANHIIHSNFPILDFDIARKEILSYINSNDKLTLSRIYNLADNSVSLYNSKLKYFTENELGVNAFNVATQKMEYVNRYIDEQYYRLIDDTISYISSDFVDFFSSQFNLKTYSFFNDQLYKYCNKILIYLKENKFNITNNNQQNTVNMNNPEIDYVSDKYYATMLIDSLKKYPDNLMDYIMIEAKKANANFVDYETFFNRCNETVNSFYKAIEISLSNKKDEIMFTLKRAINKETDFKNQNTELTLDQKFQNDIDSCNKELAALDITKFSADIRPLTKRDFDSFLKYNEILIIEKAIDEAFENYKSKNIDIVIKNEQQLNISSVEKNDIITEIQKETIQDNKINTKTFDNLVGISRYIINVGYNDLNHIVKFKQLPEGIEKIEWIGSKADAIRFAVYFKMTIKQLNECFVSKNGKFKANNKDKYETTSDIINLLKEK